MTQGRPGAYSFPTNKRQAEDMGWWGVSLLRRPHKGLLGYTSSPGLQDAQGPAGTVLVPESAPSSHLLLVLVLPPARRPGPTESLL